MTKDEAVERLSKMNRQKVARETGMDYMWLSRLVWGKIKNPRAANLDKLREYLGRMQ